MPELADVFGALINSAQQAVENSEKAHLLAQVTALTKLEGKAPGLADLESAFASGWMPDYFVGEELQIAAQLVTSSGEERTISGGGAVTVGPISINATIADTFRNAQQTNLSVNLTLKRQSRSAGLDYALQQLGLPLGGAAQVPVTPTNAGTGG